MVIIGVVLLIVLLLKWKDLMVVFFDEIYVRIIGLKLGLFKVVFFILLFVFVVVVM